MDNICPCGSGAPYSDCCAPILSGEQVAKTAEQLMRARYSAHVKVDVNFLLESTHPDHRKDFGHEETRNWAENSEWYGLEILETAMGKAADDTGEVEFVARFRDREGRRAHHERARFVRHEEKWFFTEGALIKAQPVRAAKVGRNDPCPCGSGKKFKKCCG